MRSIVTVALILGMPALAAAQLKGSESSVHRQYRVATSNGYSFLRNSAQVREFVREDRLERVRSGKNILLENVSFPFARPEVKLFVERLGAQYRAATGERLVVTSLTRPKSRQPRNASDLSVHPAGMAVDLRIPRSASARRWLEKTLLALEESEVLDATKERKPAHYHIAVFPRAYTRYVAQLESN
jgi:hypothetical protein